MADMAVRFRSGPVARSDDYPTLSRLLAAHQQAATRRRAIAQRFGSQAQSIGSAGHVRNPELTTLGQTIGSAEPMALFPHRPFAARQKHSGSRPTQYGEF